MDQLLLMRSFARTMETGSFSAAARSLGLSQPSVSRYVAALEEHLGRRLLNRSTRQLHPTPEGERYYASVRHILEAVDEAESALKGDVGPSGLLRVACPTALAHEFVVPRVPEFLRANPELELELQISDRFVSLIDEGAEVALRVGHLTDSALRARRVGVFRRVCVASAVYVRQQGQPTTPEELAGHHCIVYSLLSTGAIWHFAHTQIAVSGRLRVNSPQAVREAALAGLGIALGPLWLFEEGLRSGQLLRVLEGHEAPLVPIHLISVANRLLPRRVTAFTDFIVAAFAKLPALNGRDCACP